MAIVTLLAALGGAVPAGDSGRQVEVAVTQKYLVPVCLDGTPVKPGERRWQLDLEQHELAFTMRNAPRRGAPEPGAERGIAVIRFTPESGHRYEVEVRAPQDTYSRRVWTQGEWRPVVRDRTVDRLVSTAPEWRASACGQR